MSTSLPPPDVRPTPRPRGEGIGRGITWLATWGLRLLLVLAATYAIGLVIGRFWSIVLPVLLALLLTSILWPPTALLRRKLPPALAALVTLLGALVVIVGALALLAPSVTDQVGDIARQATDGLRQIQDWVTGPPLNLADKQVDDAVQAATDRLQSSASTLASGVLSGVTAVTSALVTGALVLVLTFFFLKDGPRFLPWLTGLIGERGGRHVDVVLRRSWATLGSFIRGQAFVGMVDAVLIGIGLVVLRVPLALPLAVLTFVGGFVPIIGATIAGALAVLVALVTRGTTTAVIVLIIIIAVQQIEGNVLQPVLQSRGLKLHPAVVILAVAAGGGLYGVTGAFLSVPVAAVAAVVLRYLGEVLDGAHPETGGGHDPVAEEAAGDADADIEESRAKADAVPAAPPPAAP